MKRRSTNLSDPRRRKTRLGSQISWVTWERVTHTQTHTSKTRVENKNLPNHDNRCVGVTTLVKALGVLLSIVHKSLKAYTFNAPRKIRQNEKHISQINVLILHNCKQSRLSKHNFVHGHHSPIFTTPPASLRPACLYFATVQ